MPESAAGPADYQFLPLFPQVRLHGVQKTREDGAVTMGGMGSAPWFNPRSAAYRSLTLADPLPPMMETDSVQGLRTLRDPEYAPRNEFVVYQHWWDPDPEGFRPIGQVTGEAADAIAAAVKGGPVRNLILITGGFARSALQRLGFGLRGHDLDLLGLFWCFTGDDLTDSATGPDEIGTICKHVNVKKLSIVSGGFNLEVEIKLADALGKLGSLQECKVFRKDELSRFPLFSTPRLDERLRRGR